MEIESLDNLPIKLFSDCGGKARGLFLLSKAGLPISPGFIITDVESAEDIGLAASYYLKSGLGEVAVRSSATNEDGDAYSNAGQYSTFLNIQGEKEFIKAVKGCLASLENERAKEYSRLFLNGAKAKMTLVVEKMVDASKAGVCFTESPSDKSQLLIEAVPGVGEGLVSGDKRAEQYFIGDSASYDGKLLNAQELSMIALGAKKAEKAFGKPLDLEWAIDKKGRLFWLQARPITTSEEPAIDEFDSKDCVADHVITTCNIREMMPGAVTPLTLSTSMEAIDWGMRSMLAHVHAFPSMEAISKGSCIRSYSNHIFIDMTPLFKIEKSVLGASSSAVQLSLCGRIYPEIKEDASKAKPFIVRAYNGMVYAHWMMSCPKAKRRIRHMALTVSFDLSKDINGLYQELKKKQKDLDTTLYYHYITSSFSGAMCSAIMIAMDPEYADKNELKAKVALALEGIQNIESADILASLKRLAIAMLKENPSLKEASAPEIAAFLTSCQGEVRIIYGDFMKRHGHRAVREAEMRSKPWSRDSLTFAADLKAVLASPESAFEPEVDVKKNIASLLAPYHGLKRSIFRKIVKNARKGVYYREYSKSQMVRVIDSFKEGYEALAHKLVDKRMLPDSDLIYFLTLDEIGRLIEGDSGLVKKALARRRLLDAQARLRFSEVNFGKPIPRSLDENVSGLKSFMGTSISVGTALGKARVVRNTDDANNLQKGEIMVAAFTDIGWSPYYCLISGLITEIGSALSHGGVVARECALPLIANVSDATSLIKTGDWVYMDAGKGIVRILSEEEKNQLLARN